MTIKYPSSMFVNDGVAAFAYAIAEHPPSCYAVAAIPTVKNITPSPPPSHIEEDKEDIGEK